MDLEARINQFFQLATAQDWEGFEQMFAPDARAKQSIGEESDIPTLMLTLKGISDAGITTGYENVRRVVGDSAVVEQHDVRLTRPDGVEVVVDICVVAQFDEAGLIARIDEYFDSAAIAPLLS